MIVGVFHELAGRSLGSMAHAIPPNSKRPLVRRAVDGSGRLIRQTDEQIRARAAEIARALDEISEMGDEQEQRETLAALMAGMNAEPLSDRPRFRPCE
jgi:hypothetical protein